MHSILGHPCHRGRSVLQNWLGRYGGLMVRSLISSTRLRLENPQYVPRADTVRSVISFRKVLCANTHFYRESGARHRDPDEGQATAGRLPEIFSPWSWPLTISSPPSTRYPHWNPRPFGIGGSSSGSVSITIPCLQGN